MTRAHPPTKSSRRKPRQARAQATVDAILIATAQLLGRAGLAHLTTDRIAERAGVSVGSVYQYFPDKKELVRALIQRERELVRDVLGRALETAAGKPLGESIGRIVRVVVEHQAARADYHEALFHEAVHWLGDEHHASDANRALAEDLLAEFLRGRRAEIGVRNEAHAAFVIVQSVNALAHETFVSPRHGIDAEALIREATTLVSRYLERRDA
jgi:AcrR family transcriptional regulator